MSREEYCGCIQKFISAGVDQLKECFFNYLDQNKDKRVCETDLFKVMKSVQSFEMDDVVGIYLLDDVLGVLRALEQLRVEEGKDDQVALLRREAHKNSKVALETRGSVEKIDHAAEVRSFLREIKGHQDRIKRSQEQGADQFAAGQEDDEPIAEVMIPNNVKPFLNKDINFDLFLEMLTEKVDAQRVSLTLKPFQEI